MNKLLTIILVSIFIFSSCQQEKSEDESKPSAEVTSTFDSTSLKTTAVETDEDHSFVFRYKFSPEESFKYRLTTITNTEQTIVADSSMSEGMNQKLIFVLKFKTLSIDQDSIAELECNFSSINLNAKARGQEFNYQSGSQMDSSERVQFAEYEALVNNPFNLRVSKLGAIIDIYKADRIMNKFLSLRNLSDSLDAQQKIMAAQDLTNRSIKPLLTQIFREMPEHKMAKDSTWSWKRDSMPIMVFNVEFENKYRVENLEMLGDDELAVITGSVKTIVTGEPNHTEKGVKYNFDKPISTANGKIYFNIIKGLIQKSKSETRMQNAYKMEMTTPEGVKKASAKEVNTNINVVELL